MNTDDEREALIRRFDAMRDSGICSPTTRGLLDDAERLLRRQGPITDAQVEAASIAFGGIHSPSWERAAEWEREEVRDGMRSALKAAREVS